MTSGTVDASAVAWHTGTRITMAGIEAFHKLMGRRIREAREAAGWTQAQLGKALGIPPESISRYENAKMPATLELLWKISGRLNIPMESLIRGDRPEPEPFFPPPAIPKEKRILPRDQAELLEKFSRLPPRLRMSVIPFLDTLYDTYISNTKSTRALRDAEDSED